MVPVFIEVREVKSSSHLLTKYTNVQRAILTGLKARGGGGGVLDISLSGELQCGPSYPDPV